MSRKQILIVIGVLLSLCLCVVLAVVGLLAYAGKTVGDAVQNASDPAKAQSVADAVAEFTLPEGYKMMAMDLFAYKMVMLSPESGLKPMIMLMQFSSASGMSEEQMQEQMQRSFAQQSGQSGMTMRVVEVKTMTIRGKEAKVTILEGTSQGSPMVFRQAITVFEGKNGAVMLMAQGTTEYWDDQVLTEFVESIK